jgi:phage tail sheath protein FI
VAEFLSPGVFIEEVPSSVQTIQAVSTSTMGAVGFTPQGPTDEATLVTSFAQFTQIFGGFTLNSVLPLCVAAFFANGGTNAYIVRVVPADAVAATGYILSEQTDQGLEETPDGTVKAFHKSDSPTGPSPITNLIVNAGATPIQPKSLSIRWRPTGAASAAVQVTLNDGSTPAAGDGTTTNFALRLAPSDFTGSSNDILDANFNPTDPALDLVISGTGNDVTLHWTVTTGKTLVFPGSASGPVVSATNADATGTFDRRTGRISIVFTAPPDNATVIAADYTKAANTVTITDDGSGNLIPAGSVSPAILDSSYATTVNGVAPNTVHYAHGGYNFETLTGKQPHSGARMLATYQIWDWTLAPVSKGAWANNMQVTIQGDASAFVAGTDSYTTFLVNIQLFDSGTQSYQVVETYDGIVFNDPTSAMYFPNVINSLSAYISVNPAGGNEEPLSLDGVARGGVIWAGNGVAANAVVATQIFGGPIAKRSVSITFKGQTSGLTKTITDNGSGTLVGAIDPTYTSSTTYAGVTVGPNAIDYASGVVNFKTVEPIATDSFVTVAYYSQAVETQDTTQFGDTALGWVAGADGTFNSTNYGPNQFTDPSLEASFKGLYALDKVSDILQVIIPDFAGDTVVTGALLDYADTHAASPAGGDRFIILTVPKGSNPQQAVDYFRFTLARFSKWAAIYWPWIKVADPLQNNRAHTIPALGHIAGIYARTDATRNVGKAPAGTVDGQLSFQLGLEYVSTQGERDLVYPNRINPLIQTPQTGTAVWGVRTISPDPQWLYVNARRLFMFLEKSVYNSTQWIVFENNGPQLWARINLQLSSFLLGLFQNGYFAGNTPADAFFVKVDNTNNTAATINAGQVIIDVGVAPNTPAEFVVFRFQQITQG